MSSLAWGKFERVGDSYYASKLKDPPPSVAARIMYGQAIGSLVAGLASPITSDYPTIVLIAVLLAAVAASLTSLAFGLIFQAVSDASHWQFVTAELLRRQDERETTRPD